MTQEEHLPEPTGGRRRGKWFGLSLAAIYLAVVAAVAWGWRPVTPIMLVAIALAPGMAMALAGIPKVARPGPRGLMALFHLGLFPLWATLAAGLPAAVLAWMIAERLGDG